MSEKQYQDFIRYTELLYRYYDSNYTDKTALAQASRIADLYRTDHDFRFAWRDIVEDSMHQNRDY